MAQSPRAFSLIEMMAVVAIVGIGASLAVPSFQEMAVHYRATEAFRLVSSAVSDGRALAARSNAPVRVRVFGDHIELATADHGLDADSVRRTVSNYTIQRSLNFPGATLTALKFLDSSGATVSTEAAGAASAVFFFCASSDNYYRDTSGVPICGIGNTASADVKVVATAGGETQHVRVRRAIGSIDLRGGG